MSNVVPMPIEREPGSVAEWRRALAAAEQRCADSRTLAKAHEERARHLKARVALLEVERDAAVDEARCADLQRRMMADRLEAMRWSVPILAAGFGMLLGGLVMALGMLAVMA